ncbi:MAG: TolC family protein [Geobacteraceae bacterium]|nr:TolC family protein [Geobacteraceae bacterium]
MLRKRLLILSIPLQLLLMVTSALSSQGAGLTIRDCLVLAEKNNHTLKLASHDSAIQLENVKVAEGSYFPRLDLQAGYSTLMEPQAMKVGTTSIDTQQSAFPFASVGLYQTLYDFGRRGSRKEQASLQESAVRAGTAAVRQDVSLQVVRAYYGILESNSFVAIAKDEVSQREQHLKIATALFEEGVTTKNDLLQAEVKLAGSRQRLLAENSRLTNSWLLLNYLTGNPANFRATLGDEGNIEHVTVKSYKDALDKRDEIAAQKLMVSSAESFAKESRDEFFPELFLKASVDYLKNDKVVEQAMVGATVGIKMNLFDGMATTARQRQAVKLLEKEKERLRGMEETYLLEMEAARNDMDVALERIEVSKAAIRQSEENLRINDDRYKAQVGTATEVIDAQTLLSQARNDNSQAIFDYQVAKARLKRAMGEL